MWFASYGLHQKNCQLIGVTWCESWVSKAWDGAKKFSLATFGAAPPSSIQLLHPWRTQYGWSPEQTRTDWGIKQDPSSIEIINSAFLTGAKKARAVEKLTCWSQAASGESSLSWTSHSPPHCAGQRKAGQETQTQERTLLQVHRICSHISLDRAGTEMHKSEKADIWPVCVWASNQIKCFPAYTRTADFQKLHFCQKILLFWRHLGKCARLEGAENRKYLKLLKEWLLCCGHLTQHWLWHPVFQWCCLPNLCLLQELTVIPENLHSIISDTIFQMV